MNNEIVSRVYRPDAAKCCERCVFGTGEHAAWCCVGGCVNLDAALRCVVCRTQWRSVIEFAGSRRRSPEPAMADPPYDECA